MFKRIKEDIESVRQRDPAATSAFQIYFLYPGLKAVRMYRRAHWFYMHKHYFLARWISQRCVRKTGIEIHPGAKIGKRFFIDHGVGVVIGETTEIGDDVTLYQGVTLGGTGKDTGKRHPTIGNNVMVGAGAKVLGPIKIGNNCKVAAGAVVLDNIPDDSTAVGVPARVVRRSGEKLYDLDQVHLPDPVSQKICELEYKIEKLNKQLSKLNGENK
ncbi:MAG: serine O-acetyltransferase EpsC [Acutalibacteraceae bacterium]|nr:serine O-acetyltransferase EpsC [Acutalibacteraceae bacterium]